MSTPRKAPYGHVAYTRKTKSGLAQIRAKGTPRTYYRGTVPGETKRITTGSTTWDSYLFVTDDPEKAKMYGPQIDAVHFKMQGDVGTAVLSRDAVVHNVEPTKDSLVEKMIGGPYLGPRGGKWADPQHTRHWEERWQDAAHPAIRGEVVDAARRAVSVGADPETMKYVGAGAEGIIFEEGDKAYKVGRSREFRPEGLRNEAEALQSLQDSKVAHLVPKIHAYNREHDVLVRDMVPGRPGGWGTRGLSEAHDQIAAELKAREWTIPEYKENSFIVDDQGEAPQMVDLGFVYPTGKRLVSRLRERMDNLQPDDDLFDLQLDISHAYDDGGIDLVTARDWLDRAIAAVTKNEMGKQFRENLQFTAKMRGDLKEGQTLDSVQTKQAEAGPRLKKAGGPFIGPRGGKWADLRHTIPWREPKSSKKSEVEQVESSIYKEPVEHLVILKPDGSLLSRFSGTKYGCQIPREVVRLISDIDGIVLTHNHPGNGCLSPEDIHLAVGTNAEEMRAVTGDGTTIYSLKRPGENWGLQQAAGAEFRKRLDWVFDKAVTRAKLRMDRHIVSSGGTPGSTADPHFSEELWNEYTTEELFEGWNKLLGEWYGWKVEKLPGPTAVSPRRGHRAGRKSLNSEVRKSDVGSEPGLTLHKSHQLVVPNEIRPGDPVTHEAFMTTVLTRPGKVKPIGEGRFGARQIVFANGLKATLKPKFFSNEVFRGIPRDTQYLREAAAYQLDWKLLHFGVVPPTTLTSYSGQPASVQAWVVGTPASKIVPHAFNRVMEGWEDRLSKLTAQIGLDDLRKIVLLDLIMNNTDRHAKNVIFDTFSHRAWAIDNGLAFGRYFDRYYNVFHRDIFRYRLEITPEERDRFQGITADSMVSTLTRYLKTSEILNTYERLQWVLAQPNLGFAHVSGGNDGRNSFPTYEKWFEKQKYSGGPVVKKIKEWGTPILTIS